MNRYIIGVFCLCFAALSNAQESLTVYVRGEHGTPITNATVTLKTMNKLKLFGSNRADDFDSHTAVTDTSGCAVIKFKCLNGAFCWWVSAPDCYSHEAEDCELKLKEYNSLHPELLEHEIVKEVVLRKRINPRAMYLRGSYPRVRIVRKDGVFGFDLKVFDWVSPHGKGVTSDFLVKQKYDEDDLKLSVSGALMFADGDGGYICKKHGNKSFSSAYKANTNEMFVSCFEFEEGWSKSGMSLLKRRNILNEDEYMVLRTRTVRDETGRLVRANYSEIIGPFTLTCKDVEMRLSIFNPDANDTNLEFDWHQNLSKRRK